MNVLIVEDDDIKFDLLSGFFKEDMPGASLARAASYQAGVLQLTTKAFDVVLLDMTLPVSDLELSPVGMEWLTFGGACASRVQASQDSSANCDRIPIQNLRAE